MRFNKLSNELSKLDEVCSFTFNPNGEDNDFYTSYVSAFIYTTNYGFRLVFVADEYLVAFKELYHDEFERGALCELNF